MTPRSLPPFDGLELPEPPAELRERTLARARSGMLSAEPPDLWIRMWASRTVRLTWAVAVTAMLVANLVVHRPKHVPESDLHLPAGFALRDATSDEIAELADLPRIAVDPINLSSAVPPEPAGASGPGAPAELESRS